MGEPSKTSPLGMTETPTLRVSADLLDLKAAPPSPVPSWGLGKRGEIASAPCPHLGQASEPRTTSEARPGRGGEGEAEGLSQLRGRKGGGGRAAGAAPGRMFGKDGRQSPASLVENRQCGTAQRLGRVWNAWGGREGRRQCGWAQNSFPPAVVQAFGSETYESLTRVPNLSLTPRLGGVGGVGPIMMCLTRSRCTPSKERNQTAIRDQSITFGQLYCLQVRKCSSGPLCLTVYGLLRAPVEEGSPE